MEVVPTGYPVTLEIDEPRGELDRLTCFFRPLLVVPILVLLTLVSGPTLHANEEVAFEAGGVLFAATALMLLVRHKYPRWWFDWNVGLTRFGLRVAAYAALLQSEYPSTDEEQAVHVGIPYPDAERDLSRWLPLVKWLLALPHLLALAFLGVAALAAVVGAWCWVLLTGRYPKVLFEFVVGVMRWWLRVMAYAFLLTTDRYPPFSLAR